MTDLQKKLADALVGSVQAIVGHDTTIRWHQIDGDPGSIHIYSGSTAERKTHDVSVAMESLAQVGMPQRVAGYWGV